MLVHSFVGLWKSLTNMKLLWLKICDKKSNNLHVYSWGCQQSYKGGEHVFWVAQDFFTAIQTVSKAERQHRHQFSNTSMVERRETETFTVMSGSHVLIGGLGGFGPIAEQNVGRVGGLWFPWRCSEFWEVFSALCRSSHDNEGSKGSEGSVRKVRGQRGVTGITA